MELNGFRLESYDERAALLYALELMRSVRPDNYYKEVAETLLLRLSRTKCQPGGCSYCGGDDE